MPRSPLKKTDIDRVQPVAVNLVQVIGRSCEDLDEAAARLESVGGAGAPLIERLGGLLLELATDAEAKDTVRLRAVELLAKVRQQTQELAARHRAEVARTAVAAQREHNRLWIAERQASLGADASAFSDAELRLLAQEA